MAVYHPRAAGEWQGMLVNMTLRAQCERSSGCGLGAACIDGLCGPCRNDSECADGEVCVLDHCLVAQNAKCRSRRECPGDETLCILSGYSPDPRGNAKLIAECKGARGGQARPDDWQPPKGLPAPPPPVNTFELMEAVRKIANNRP